MHISSATVKQLKTQYPYAEPFLSCFIPLEECCHKLAEELPPPIFPEDDEIIFGDPFCRADKEHLDIYLDDALLGTCKEICLVAAKQVKEYSKELKELAKFLEKDPAACKHLASLTLLQKKHRISAWAKKHGMQKYAASFASNYLARCAALRVAKHAKKPEEWSINYCPTCGSLPNAGYLQTTEGHRFLHCSMCSSTWRFPRTVCPACGDNKPEGRLVFDLEGGNVQQRAEGCEVCKHYMLVPDIRDLAEDIPIAILLYCLMPMDALMQDKGYKPLENID